MKAIIQTAYGKSDVLEHREIVTPEPSAEQIRVRVVSASVTTADTMMRQGTPWYGRLFIGVLKPRYPIAGTGFSGVVDMVGDDVTQFNVGDNVFGESVFGGGSYCEYICMLEDGVLTRRPSSISHEEAAPVCDGALTAYNFLCEIGGLRPGHNVLINGAAGSLGSAAVQIAKAAGAQVTAVCSESNNDFVRGLGADHCIDYSVTDFTRTEERFDIVFDAVGKSSYRDCRRILSNDGLYLSPDLSFPLLVTMLWTKYFSRRKAIFSATGLLPHSMLSLMLGNITEMLSNGQIRTMVEHRYPLYDAAKAHDLIETGHKRGNVVLDVSA